jgi:hypothetical protein
MTIGAMLAEQKVMSTQKDIGAISLGKNPD